VPTLEPLIKLYTANGEDSHILNVSSHSQMSLHNDIWEMEEIWNGSGLISDLIHQYTRLWLNFKILIAVLLLHFRKYKYIGLLLECAFMLDCSKKTLFFTYFTLLQLLPSQSVWFFCFTVYGPNACFSMKPLLPKYEMCWNWLAGL